MLQQHWGMDLCGVEVPTVKLAIINVFLQWQESYFILI
jgi:hypothetical protein